MPVLLGVGRVHIVGPQGDDEVVDSPPLHEMR